VRQVLGVLMLVLAITILGTSYALAACGTTTLVVSVRDLHDAPAANISFVVEIDGATQTVRTDAAGLIAVPMRCGVNGTPTSARIVSASGADGSRLLMDENSTEGGLVIPIIAGGTQQEPFRLSGTLLFVEPVADPDQSTAVTGSTPVASMTALSAPSEAAPIAAVTPPLPQAGRPWWFWAAILLVLGVPTLLGVLVWWHRASAGWRRTR
jgi:hypothetical protein